MSNEEVAKYHVPGLVQGYYKVLTPLSQGHVHFSVFLCKLEGALSFDLSVCRYERRKTMKYAQIWPFLLFPQLILSYPSPRAQGGIQSFFSYPMLSSQHPVREIRLQNNMFPKVTK